jgi:hypothetical protein
MSYNIVKAALVKGRESLLVMTYHLGSDKVIKGLNG